MRLLLTRPEPDAERTALTLRTRGHVVLTAPLLQIEPIDVRLGERPGAVLLMTSASAARITAVNPDMPGLRDRPVFVVGAHTANAARTAGFTDVTSADGDAGDLARLVAQRFAGTGASLVYLCGQRHPTIPGTGGSSPACRIHRRCSAFFPTHDPNLSGLRRGAGGARVGLAACALLSVRASGGA